MSPAPKSLVFGLSLLSLDTRPAPAPAPQPLSAVLDVTLGDGHLRAPQSALSGWTTIRVHATDTLRHWAIAFQLEDGTDPAAFIAAFDTARATPTGATALGGPDGASTEAFVNLHAGRIVFACPHRLMSGRRHATAGEWQVVSIAKATTSGPQPAADIQVEARDYAFSAPNIWPSGRAVVALSNRGTHDHLLLIAKLKSGVTLATYATAKDTKVVADPAMGVARLSPGQEAAVPVTLAPGHYVIFCRIVDGTTKLPHDHLGMMREVVVSPPP